jgi:hypothetical protein
VLETITVIQALTETRRPLRAAKFKPPPSNWLERRFPGRPSRTACIGSERIARCAPYCGAVLSRGLTLFRVVVGPLAGAAFAGVQLARFGFLASAGGAYLAFMMAEMVVGLWTRYQLEATRQRLGRLREARAAGPRHGRTRGQ